MSFKRFVSLEQNYSRVRFRCLNMLGPTYPAPQPASDCRLPTPKARLRKLAAFYIPADNMLAL
jgi:hypothetical protein